MNYLEKKWMQTSSAQAAQHGNHNFTDGELDRIEATEASVCQAIEQNNHDAFETALDNWVRLTTPVPAFCETAKRSGFKGTITFGNCSRLGGNDLVVRLGAPPREDELGIDELPVLYDLVEHLDGPVPRRVMKGLGMLRKRGFWLDRFVPQFQEAA